MRTKSRVLAVGVAAIMTIGLGACGGSSGSSGSSDNGAAGVPGGSDAKLTATVDVADSVFKPKEIDVAAGGTVTWKWSGEETHNVVSDDGSSEKYESESQTSGTFKHTFDKAGTYKYHCTLHEGMTGTVKVS